MQVVIPILGWRWLLALSSVPSFFLLFFYVATPESPRYLCSKGNYSEALRVLQRIAKINGRAMPLGELIGRRGPDEIVDSDHRDQEEDASLLIERDPTVKSGTVAVLFSQKLMKSTLLLWIVFFGNAFLYYGIVLLTTKLSDGRSRCRGEDREGGDVALYKDVLIASFAGKIHDILILFIDRTVIDLNYFRGSGGDNTCYRGG